MYGVFVITGALIHEICPFPVNTTKSFWPIGDRINGVALYVDLTLLVFC